MAGITGDRGTELVMDVQKETTKSTLISFRSKARRISF